MAQHVLRCAEPAETLSVLTVVGLQRVSGLHNRYSPGGCLRGGSRVVVGGGGSHGPCVLQCRWKVGTHRHCYLETAWYDSLTRPAVCREQ